MDFGFHRLMCWQGPRVFNETPYKGGNGTIFEESTDNAIKNIAASREKTSESNPKEDQGVKKVSETNALLWIESFHGNGGC